MAQQNLLIDRGKWYNVSFCIPQTLKFHLKVSVVFIVGTCPTPAVKNWDLFYMQPYSLQNKYSFGKIQLQVMIMYN